MFLEYFRLREQPFGVTPDPRYLFPSPAHREALASLMYGIESNLGFGGIIAEPGMGKTTLLFHILEQYRQSARTAFIFNTQCSSHDLLRSLLSEVDEEVSQRDMFQLHERFKEVLATEAQAGRRVILVIDEAQNLGDVVMETVRLLSNFESAEFKLLHIILAGQPQLAEKLARSERSQLQQRIPILNRLQRLSSEETAAYIEHRLHVAGYNGRPLFTREALTQIAILSRGVPREINRLCFNCLSLACASSKHAVDLPVVEEVAADLDLSLLVARDTEDESTRIRQASQTAVFANTTAMGATTASAYCELPIRKPQGRTPLAAAARFANESRAVANGRTPIRRKAEESKKGSSVYRWPVRRRPAAFALLYLTLIAAGWAAVNRWVDHESQVGGRESRRSQPLVQPPDVKVKTSSGLSAADARTPRSTNAEKGPRTSLAKQLRGNSNLPATAAVKQNPPAETVNRQPERRWSQPVKTWAATASDQQPFSSSQLDSRDTNDGTEIADRGSFISTPAQPELVRYIPPRYPDMARDRHIEGRVVLNALVARDGTIKTLRPVSGDPALLNAAEAAVRRWVYRPYRVNGQPVEIDTEIVISFSLTNDRNF